MDVKNQIKQNLFQINEAEVLELINRDDETEDNGSLVKLETGDSAEKSKTDKIKSESEEKSGSLTVTVSKNKKGRSVADSDAVSRDTTGFTQA